MKPILFNTEMVRAILEGRKTQTRRVLKPQPEPESTFMGWVLPEYVQVAFGQGVKTESLHKCPYGKIGDVLWVRESFTKSNNGTVVFRADATDETGQRWHSIEKGDPNNEVKWKPSIYMPFEAARIFLEITNIRVERLYDISHLDAINEGIEYLGTGDYGPEWKCYFDAKHDTPSYALPCNSFMSLWISINGEDSWNSNPWVWVVEFKRIQKP